MEEAKTIEIEYIEHESHLYFHNMSTLLVANEHASWMWAVHNTKIPNKYQVFLYKQCIKFFCINNVRLKTIELLDTYYEKRQLGKWHMYTFGNYKLFFVNMCLCFTIYMINHGFSVYWLSDLLVIRYCQVNHGKQVVYSHLCNTDIVVRPVAGILWFSYLFYFIKKNSSFTCDVVVDFTNNDFACRAILTRAACKWWMTCKSKVFEIKQSITGKTKKCLLTCYIVSEQSWA